MTSIKIKKIGSANKTTSVSMSLPYDNLKTNHTLIAQVLNSYRARLRSSNSHTKTRAEVKATGKKPYRQKGTGYARFGSLVTPIHKGGGIAFGPRNSKNYSKKIPKKLKNKSLAIILKEKSEKSLIYQIEKIDIDKPSTKKVLEKVSKFDIKKGDILLVTPKNDKKLYLSTRNIPFIDIKEARLINLLDLLTHDNIVFINDAYKKIFDKNDIKKTKKDIKKEDK